MSEAQPLQSLLTPYTMNGLRLPNRVVMAPLTRSRATNADLAPSDLHVKYYGQRASAGLIITEATNVKGQMFGVERLDAVLAACRGDAGQTIEAIRRAVDEFVGCPAEGGFGFDVELP